MFRWTVVLVLLLLLCGCARSYRVQLYDASNMKPVPCAAITHRSEPKSVFMRAGSRQEVQVAPSDAYGIALLGHLDNHYLHRFTIQSDRYKRAEILVAPSGELSVISPATTQETLVSPRANEGAGGIIRVPLYPESPTDNACNIEY